MKCYLFLILAICVFKPGHCQSDIQELTQPEIGKPMPNFSLTDVENYPQKKVSLKDFRGKWLILDWWTKYCVGCIASFPKIDSLQREFKDKVQYILIGYTGSWDVNGRRDPGAPQVQSIYERFKKIKNPIVPFAFDSSLYQRYRLGTTPYIIVISPDGIVKTITTELTSQNMRELLAGKPVSLTKAYRIDQSKPEYDHSKPFLTFGKDGPDTAFLFRSLLANWKVNTAMYNPYFIPKNALRFEQIGSGLKNLFKLAYIGQYMWLYGDTLYGNFFPEIILETKDSAIFSADWNNGINIYNYSVSVPPGKGSKDLIMQIMQGDLYNYFGLKGKIEIRKMPYWRLTATEDAKEKLRSKGGKTSGSGVKGVSIYWHNMPIKELTNALASYFFDYPPFINETGIDGNIDISIEGVLTDFDDFKRALKVSGLNLEKGEKEMKVLVIRGNN